MNNIPRKSLVPSSLLPHKEYTLSHKDPKIKVAMSLKTICINGPQGKVDCEGPEYMLR